jgi:anti-sigma factor RsiW
MHAVLMESLEEYLAGTLEPAELREIDAHLAICPSCSEELQGMQEVSLCFGSLRSEETVTPSPYFFAKVMRQVQEPRPQPGFASLFSLDLSFGRRLVFASLMTLAVAGSYLVTREMENSGVASPTSVMAQQNAPGFDSAPAPDNMLVTLTAYER